MGGGTEDASDEDIKYHEFSKYRPIAPGYYYLFDTGMMHCV